MDILLTAYLANEPETLANAFQIQTDNELVDIGQTWWLATREKTMPQYHTEELDSPPPPPYKGLDRTRIPATADTLILDSAGLSTTVFALNSLRPKRLPTQTVGEHIDPAYMSYGRALHMFGLPTDPGADLHPKPATHSDDAAHRGPMQIDTVQVSPVQIGATEGSSTDASMTEASTKDADPVAIDQTIDITEDMSRASISAESTTDRAPTTEREYRDKYFAPTQPISDSETWKDVLSAKKLGRWLPILCKQYVQLVRAKQNGTAIFGNEGWPAVDGMDFQGLVNWIERCRASDPTFKVTLQQWDVETDDRMDSLVERIGKSKATAALNDIILCLGSAKDYYKAEQSILARDLTKLKMTHDATGAKSKPNPKKR